MWLYFRFPLSFREVEELMLECGVIVSYETVRRWCLKFGQQYVDGLRRRQPRPGDKWYLDEVFIKINGEQKYLWRAVDADGMVLDILVQSRWDTAAARRFFRTLLTKTGEVPRVIVTDKLRSYGAAHHEVMPSVEHRSHKGPNNRAENSHQPTRQRERAMKGFRSVGAAQRFLSAFICERMLPLISPTAWVIDDVSVPKDGRISVAVAPQYCGALGKRANCQVAVSVHAASDTAFCPLQWRLFLPKEWDADTDRRALARVPSEAGHREKWRLALDMLDTLADWDMRPPVVVADAAYGTNAHLRAGLAQRGIDYVLAVRADLSAHPFDAKPAAPDRKGPVGCWPQPRYRHRAPSVAALAAELGQEAFTSLTWRQGLRGQLRSRFAAVRVRPAGKAVERPIRAAASAGQGWWDGILPDCWLLIEWPEDAEAPTDYWLSGLPADTPIADLVRLAKVRWRIEHDYRELKHGLGLDHFEGRFWPGWHHHVTLVTAAHAFLTEQRLAPKAPTPGSLSTRPSTPSRTS